MPKKKSRKRHLAKTITWRVLASIDTMVIGWLVSGNPLVGISIGGAEILTKIVLYYIHERVWYHSKFSAKKKPIIKSITWRIIGSTDTMLLAWLISGNPLIGLKVGSIEIFTKIALYYFHEKLWHLSDYGIKEE